VVSVDYAVVAPERYHILGHPADLAGHVAALGPLPVPTTPGPEWREALLGSLEASGLTGRGGAGFPAAIKAAVARAAGTGGTILVNAMEGEPASDKDKLLLIRSPHVVLDGAQLLAAATGAAHVTVCVPAGREQAAAAAAHALAERAVAGWAPVAEHLVRPPDRFVAGEESALVQWVDAGRSLPSFRPQKGTPLRVGRRAALVHNAETLAHVSMIGRFGADAFRSHGPSDDPGTSLITISGAVTHPGVVEVARGTPLLDIAARATPLSPPRALLVGGYGGSWVGSDHFTTPYASLPLRAIGAAAGAGILIVLGHEACGLTETARVVHYMAGQSSGQCGPCVYGLPAIADDMARLARGTADPGLLGRLDRRLNAVNGRGACRHPDGVVALVRSALAVFAADARAHANGAPCPHWNRPTQMRFPPVSRAA
jgi:NADH:ubiquinone oxidoreductase subunit F (NADH-binding)